MKRVVLYCSPNPIGVSPRQLRALEELMKANTPVVILETKWVYKERGESGLWPFVEKRKYKSSEGVLDVYSVKLITLALNRIQNIYSIFSEVLSLLVYSVIWLSIILYLIPKLKVGAIWCSNAPDLPCTIVAIVKKIFRNRLMYIYELRELTPELYCIRATGEAYCPFYAILRLLERIAYSSADIVVTVSVAMRDYISRLYRSIQKAIIPLYPFPPHAEKFANRSDTLRLQKKDKIIAIYGGSVLEKIYDLPLVIEALTRLYPQIKNRFQLLIIGRGDETALQYILRAKNEMPEVIDFMGFMPAEKYYQKLKEVDMCIVPLTLNQLTSIAVPNKLIDCIITGKIVITSALPSTVELAKRFPEAFLLYKPGSVESLSETIVNAIANRTNTNNVHSTIYKFSKLFYTNFSKILNLIKIFTTNG
ncbi:glycosyltransferase [Pyrobaculum aerophilum]|uniref:glycosyltransferase n=1 Tax=Pyrobaculum aerophilum TaxID=13773 RepID=UPI002FD94742